MYDAKNFKEENEYTDLRYPVIMDRSYFSKVQAENIVNLKTSHVPLEDVIKLD